MSKRVRREREPVVLVSKRALVQRINRKLALDGATLRAARGDAERKRLGEFYVVRAGRDHVERVSLESLGKNLGALREYERIRS